jgi:hypothetical protein
MGQQVLAVGITGYPEAFLIFFTLCPVATEGCGSAGSYALVTYTMSRWVSILQQKRRRIYAFSERALRRASPVLEESI